VTYPLASLALRTLRVGRGCERLRRRLVALPFQFPGRRSLYKFSRQLLHPRHRPSPPPHGSSPLHGTPRPILGRAAPRRLLGHQLVIWDLIELVARYSAPSLERHSQEFVWWVVSTLAASDLASSDSHSRASWPRSPLFQQGPSKLLGLYSAACGSASLGTWTSHSRFRSGCTGDLSNRFVRVVSSFEMKHGLENQIWESYS
jgi:hypothetical protein